RAFDNSAWIARLLGVDQGSIGLRNWIRANSHSLSAGRYLVSSPAVSTKVSTSPSDWSERHTLLLRSAAPYDLSIGGVSDTNKIFMSFWYVKRRICSGVRLRLTRPRPSNARAKHQSQTT